MAAAQVPEFVTTDVENIVPIVEKVRKGFLSGKTRPIQYRIQQLRRLYWTIEDHRQAIIEAHRRDLRKGYFEVMASEIGWVQNDIIFITKHLEKWMKDETPEDIDWPYKLMTPRVRKDPLGIVLVIAPFNFPFNLAFTPMLGAIAAGNAVILKPSEQTPNVAAVLGKIIKEGLDGDCFDYVQGSIPETTALLSQKWDKIFFTGSPGTAKVVATAAARNLTPVALELGGRNPAIITRNANIRVAARRLLWSKSMNSGQVCISQNYILAEQDIVSALISELGVALKEFFPSGATDSPDYSRIVNVGSFNRIRKMLEDSSGEIVVGGKMDSKQLVIEPTVIKLSDPNDTLLVNESFGPLIPILPVENLDQAITLANHIDETPLGVYAFGSNTETTKIIAQTRSGGATINDGFFHGIIPTMPFGGIGDSGMGSYRGKASFDCFTHRRSIASTPWWLEWLLAARYPPFDGTNKYQQYARIFNRRPNFDRDGNEKVSVIWHIVTLGCSNAGGALLRAAVLATFFAGVGILVDTKGAPTLARVWQLFSRA